MVVCLVNKHRTVALVWGTVGTRNSTLLPRGAVPDIAGPLTFLGSIKLKVKIRHRWETVGTRNSTLLPCGAVPDIAGLFNILRQQCS